MVRSFTELTSFTCYSLPASHFEKNSKLQKLWKNFVRQKCTTCRLDSPAVGACHIGPPFSSLSETQLFLFFSNQGKAANTVTLQLLNTNIFSPLRTGERPRSPAKNYMLHLLVKSLERLWDVTNTCRVHAKGVCGVGSARRGIDLCPALTLRQKRCAKNRTSVACCSARICCSFGWGDASRLSPRNQPTISSTSCLLTAPPDSL